MSTTPSSKTVKTDGDGNVLLNRLLLGAATKERDFLFSKLVFLDLRLNDLIQDAGATIQYCYFPNTAMASILNVMNNGKSVEVGLAGREGFVGIPVLTGFRSSASRVVVQAEGTAFRIHADDMRKALVKCPGLMMSLIRYSQEATMEVTQIAACNRLHKVEERLARWLLMTHDRVCKDTLPLTQEFLSQMLGTRRASVTQAVAALRQAGLVGNNRGQLTVVNRKGLENASCECYKAIQKQLKIWRTELA